MLGVANKMQCLDATKAGAGLDADNNKEIEMEGKTLSFKSTGIQLSKKLTSDELNNDTKEMTAVADRNTHENMTSELPVCRETSNEIINETHTENDIYHKEASSGMGSGSSQSDTDDKFLGDISSEEQQVPEKEASLSCYNSKTVQQVSQNLNSDDSSDEEIFIRKPKSKKAVLLDDVFDDEMDNVNSKDKEEKIYRDYKTNDLFDDDNSDDIQKNNESTDPEAGQGKTANSLADSNSCHDGKYSDIFDDEKEGNESDEDQHDNNGVLNYYNNEKDHDDQDESGEYEDVFDTEETDEEVRIKKRKDGKGKKEKPHKMKKTDVQQIHSESQRMLRESTIRLPYHVPAVKPITHFLSRVPQVKKDKSKESLPIKKDPITVTSIEHNSTESPSEALPKTNGYKFKLKDITPTLSKSSDFIDFADETPPKPKLLNKGLQKLMERFAKHSSPKLHPNMDKPETEIRKEPTSDNAKKDEVEIVSPKVSKCVEPLVPEEKAKVLKTPGARLQVLKQQLQQKMKLQRAEQRKIQESQRKLDNEEMSEEEEEEEEVEEFTDEEDSDYELEKWNVEDERKQEEGESDDGNSNKREKKIFNLEENEIDSGSEGDVSDFENDKESVFSDKINSISHEILGTKKAKSDESSKTGNLKAQEVSPQERRSIDTLKGMQLDDRTMDLFGTDSRSRTDTQDSLMTNSEEVSSLRLRLDSFEDENSNAFGLYSNHNSTNPFTKVKGSHKVGDCKSPVNVSEASQDSIIDRRLSSDFDASNDSSRIPAGQGEGSKRTYSFDSDRKTPDLFPSSLSRIQSLLGGSSLGNQVDGQTSLAKPPSKLSQLTLPIEDSQDLFYDEDENRTEGENQSKCASESTQEDFHFALDEDTQFTQLLDTQGFINSSKKSKKSKTRTLFESNTFDSEDPMEELLGLCSGKFTELRSTQLEEGDNKDEEEEVGGIRNIAEEDEKDDEGEEQDEGVENPESNSDEDLDYEEKLQRKYGQTYKQPKKKLFDKTNFLENEAELSGSDVGSDEDDDGGDSSDEYEEEENDEVLPSHRELQKQINKVHMKSLLDEDKAELRLYKEMYLPDGDLYSDGAGRTRNFRWRGIDDSQLDMFDSKALWGDEDGFNLEEASEEEVKKRKERFERETFLREEMNKKKDCDIVMDIDENSQTILSKIKTRSYSTPTAVEAREEKIPTPVSTATTKLAKLPSQKGSFLNRNKQTLSKLSSITANTPNASSATRAFVFETVSAAGKSIDQGKRLRRSASMMETPSAKRPKLDRSTSHTPTGSVFSML